MLLLSIGLMIVIGIVATKRFNSFKDEDDQFSEWDNSSVSLKQGNELSSSNSSGDEIMNLDHRDRMKRDSEGEILDINSIDEEEGSFT